MLPPSFTEKDVEPGRGAHLASVLRGGQWYSPDANARQLHPEASLLPTAHLIYKHIAHPLDEKVLFAFIHQGLLLPLQDPLKELAVDADQLIQTREQLLHHLLLEEQIRHHPPAVHVAHDLERADVV